MKTNALKFGLGMGLVLLATMAGVRAEESLFSSVTIWRSLDAGGPAMVEVDVSAPEGKTITLTVPTVPATVYDVTEDEAGEYEYFDTPSNLEAQYPQGEYVLRLYSDAGKTILEETLIVSFSDGNGNPLPFPEVYPSLTQPVPVGDQIRAMSEQTYTWQAYSGTAGTATHMYLEITGTGEDDDDIAEYDAEINGSCSFTPPPVPPGDYDLEMSFFFRQSAQTAGGTLIECANERYSRYALTVAASGCQLTVTGGSGSGTTYTNRQQVTIAADPAPRGRFFERWGGDTQYVASVTSSVTTVTMLSTNIHVSAVYGTVPEWMVYEGKLQSQFIDESSSALPVLRKDSGSLLLAVYVGESTTGAVWVSWFKTRTFSTNMVATVETYPVSEKTDKKSGRITAAKELVAVCLDRTDDGNAVFLGSLTWAGKYTPAGDLLAKQTISLAGRAIDLRDDQEGFGISTLRYNSTASATLNRAENYDAMAAALRTQIKKLPADVTAETLSGLLQDAAGE